MGLTLELRIPSQNSCQYNLHFRHLQLLNFFMNP